MRDPRELDPDPETARRAASRPGGPAVQLDDPGDKGEAKTRTALPSASRIRAEERLEQMRQDLVRDAGPIVLDGELDRPVRRPG